MCVHRVGSLCCKAESNTILPSNHIQIKKNDSETDDFFQNKRSGYIVSTYWKKTKKKNTISLGPPGLQQWQEVGKYKYMHTYMFFPPPIPSEI